MERILSEEKAYEEFVELFWGTDNIAKFIIFSSLLSDMEINGVVYIEKFLFPFSKIISNNNSDGVVITDDSKNLIVFSNKNVKSVKPISVFYDVYTFEIELVCSMFPLDKDEYSTNSNNFKIRISVYSR